MSKYDSIINLPHYELKYHPRMSIENRAAQFSPYAALNGYSAEIDNASKIKYQEVILSEDEKEVIDIKLQLVKEHIIDNLPVTILYFNNNKYIEYTGIVKKIDITNRIIYFKDRKEISIDKVLNIKADFIGDNIYY